MNDPLWLVTFAYYSERADVYVVAAPDEQTARERVAETAGVGVRNGVRGAVLEESQVMLVDDGLHVQQHAEY